MESTEYVPKNIVEQDNNTIAESITNLSESIRHSIDFVADKYINEPLLNL